MQSFLHVAPDEHRFGGFAWRGQGDLDPITRLSCSRIGDSDEANVALRPQDVTQALVRGFGNHDAERNEIAVGLGLHAP